MGPKIKICEILVCSTRMIKIQGFHVFFQGKFFYHKSHFTPLPNTNIHTHKVYTHTRFSYCNYKANICVSLLDVVTETKLLNRSHSMMLNLLQGKIGGKSDQMHRNLH